MSRLKFLPFLLSLALSSCGESGDPIIRQQFDSFEGRSLEISCSDAYFAKPSPEFDARLASLSMSMSLLCSADLEEEGKSVRDVTSFYRSIGMSEIFIAPTYYALPQEGTVAYSIASKRLSNGKTLVWTAIRSENYQNEWADNFVVGTEGDHVGFRVPAEKVLADLKAFAVDKNLEGDLVLYLTGYSRGAAVASLVGGMIDDDIAGGKTTYGKGKITLDNTYAYCIETPSPSVKTNYGDARYGNIHNIVNLNDPVTMVPPVEWGFHRLGQNHYLPDRLLDIRYDKQKEGLQAIMDGTGVPFSNPDDSWKVAVKGKESHPAFARKILSLFGDKALSWIGTREDYVTRYQEAMKWLMRFIFADARSEELSNTLRRYAIALALRRAELKAIVSDIKSGDNEGATEKILSLCDKVIKDGGKTRAILEEVLPHVSPLFGIVQNAYATEGDDFDPLSMFSLFSYFPIHHRSTPYGWLMASDGQHGYAVNETWLNDGTYYRLEVENVQEMTLSLRGGETLFSLNEGKIVDSSFCAETNNGTLSLFLPKNASYSYELGKGATAVLYEVSPDGTENLAPLSLLA